MRRVTASEPCLRGEDICSYCGHSRTWHMRAVWRPRLTDHGWRSVMLSQPSHCQHCPCLFFGYQPLQCPYALRAEVLRRYPNLAAAAERMPLRCWKTDCPDCYPAAK